MRLQKKHNRSNFVQQKTGSAVESTETAVATQEPNYPTGTIITPVPGKSLTEIYKDKKATYVIKKARAIQIKAQAEESRKAGKPEHSLLEHDPAIVATLTRATLMRDAQTRGIPYFRILSREALNEILNTNITTERQAELIEAAKTKWRAGWGTGTKRTTPTAPTVIQEIAEEQAQEAQQESTKKQRKGRKAGK